MFMYVVRMHSHTSMFVSQLTHFSYKYTHAHFLFLALAALPSSFESSFGQADTPHPMSSKNCMCFIFLLRLKIKIATHWFNAFGNEEPHTRIENQRKPTEKKSSKYLHVAQCIDQAMHSMLPLLRWNTVNFSSDHHLSLIMLHLE